MWCASLLVLAMAGAAELGAAGLNDDLSLWVAGQGGRVQRDAKGEIDSVDLTSTWITDTDLVRVAALGHVRSLNLSHTKITDVGMQYLKGLTGVTDLNLYYAEYITEDGIAPLKGWTSLERLNLRGTKVTSKVFEHLAHLASLRSLDLAYTQIDDEDFEQLAALTHLEELAIGGNRLTGAALPLLKLLPALRSLDVGGIQRVDSGLWGLALTDGNLQQIAALTQLRSLKLSGANLNDVGADRPERTQSRSELRDLSKLRALVNLESLDLSNTPVSDDALEALRALPKLRELRLGLDKNIDDGSVPVLLSMASLDCLYVAGSSLTEQGIEQLRKSGRFRTLDTGKL
jgi:Leucine-rich repeat (LRR) protein